MIVIIETMRLAVKKITKLTDHGKMIIFAAVAAVTILFCLIFSSANLSYNVIYNGEVVAQIFDKAVYEQALLNAADKIICDGDSEDLLTEAEIKLTLSAGDKKETADELTDIILNNSEKVNKGYIVKVDGEKALYLSNCTEVNEALEKRLNKYNQKDKSCESKFASEITVSEAFFASASMNCSEEVTDLVDTLDVITVATSTESKKIPFDTVIKKSSSKKAGYTLVTTKGVEGVKTLNKQLTYLNGKVTEEKIVSEKVVSNPVDEVVVVGTASASKGSSNKYASSGKFVYPADKNAYLTITSYWGDGRNHQAVDIAGAVGTKIYASLAGKVTYAGYMSDYGYNVVIDHGNGMKTRYAHLSKLYVKTGEKVSAGQTIALMGNTGKSTGPHLHFEVILNETRVDPAPYLGLY